MTLEEQIKILEHNAEHERQEQDLQGCLNFRQLAEWLRELKAYREKLTEIEMAVNFYMTCETCQGFREYSTSEFVDDLVRILEVNADE